MFGCIGGMTVEQGSGCDQLVGSGAARVGRSGGPAQDGPGSGATCPDRSGGCGRSGEQGDRGERPDDGRQMAPAVCRAPARRALRRAAFRGAAPDRRRGDHRPHLGRGAARGCALEPAPSTIHRIWQAFGQPPHRSETFRLSADPLFVDKVRDITGLCLDPPERRLVLCVDEKSQIQARDRTQPLLPMRPGQVERFFAALTEKQFRRGVHRATREPEQAIRDHIDTVNANPRPFRWTRSADDILATIKRFCLRTLDTAECQKKISKTWESGQ